MLPAVGQFVFDESEEPAQGLVRLVSDLARFTVVVCFRTVVEMLRKSLDVAPPLMWRIVMAIECPVERASFPMIRVSTA